jgi:hypothetical protein
VPLDPGANEVRLRVGNAEGHSLERGAAVVTYNPPAKPPAPPEVEILDPAKDANVTEPKYTVKFRIRSATPPRHVELVREGPVPLRRPVNVATLKAVAPGVYELSADMDLEPKVNRLRVDAINDGGEQRAAVVVNYLHMPVRLEIERLEARGPEGNPVVQKKVLPDGRLEFAAAPQGRLSLKGKVTWAKENDEQLKKVNLVKVYVNGFLQVPAELKLPEGDSRARTFEADILLNQAQKNRVEIELPGVQQDMSNRREFFVDCQKPERGQQLHLLIVGVGEKNEKKLTERALQALQVQGSAPGKLKTRAFEQVRIYGPLTDYVSPEQVFTQLCLMKKTIDLRATAGSAKDVIMVYYQGEEAVKKDGHFFPTSVSQYDPDLRRSAITCSGLERFFAESLGAKVLLLDVAREADTKAAAGEGKDQIAEMPDDSYVGVMRFLRQGLTNPPDDAHLLPALKEALRKADKLKEVTDQVAADNFTRTSENESLKSKRYSQALQYNLHLPNNLTDLVLSQKP